MNYNIRFFDILNCILLGAISLSIILFTIYIVEGINYFTDISAFLTVTNAKSSTINIYSLIIGLAAVYTVGLFINSIVDYKSKFKKHIISLNSVNGSCISIREKSHKKSLSDNDYPSWIFFSENPYRVLSVLIERISQIKDENVLNEYRYLNEFFQGLFLTILICILYILCSFIFGEVSFFLINVYDANSDPHTLPTKIVLNLEKIFYTALSYCVLLFLSSILAIYYAEKLIKYISACTEAHDINIDDILLENGMPSAHILMKIDRNVTKGLLEKSLVSISKQDYQKIKIIIFIYGEQKSNGLNINEIDSIINMHKSKTIEIIKYFKEKSNKANAALEVRKIFVAISNDNDISLFLDPGDELNKVKSVSNIVKKFSITKANLCLLNFTETESIEHSLVKEDKIIHDNILKNIESNGNHINFSLQYKLYATMTLNCVKAYKKDALKYFVEAIISFDKSNSKHQFSQTGSYAGFIDFLIFLTPHIKITALSESTHNYVQFKEKHKVKELKAFYDDRIKAIDYLIKISQHYIKIDCTKDCNITLKTYQKCKPENKYQELNNYIKFKSYIILLLLKDLPFNINEKDFEFFSKYTDNGKIEKSKIFIESINKLREPFCNIEEIKSACDLKIFFEKTKEFE